MTNPTCRTIADKLIDYADGMLPPAEAGELDEHLASCPDCRNLLAALRKSLTLSSVLWRDAENHLDRTRMAKSAIHRLRRPAVIAAGILLLITASVLWRYFTPPPLPKPQMTLAEIKESINRAGIAAEMLAAAQILAQAPGGEEIARERLKNIVAQFPDTDAARKANLELQPLSTRRIIQ